MFVFKYSINKIQNDNIVTIPAAERHLRWGRPEGSVFRVWLQRPNDTTPETQSRPAAWALPRPPPRAWWALTKIAWIPVVATSRGKISRGGRFPRDVFPWWPIPVQKIPWIPVVASSRGKGFRGGQFPSQNTLEFLWWLNPAGKVPKIENGTRGRSWYFRRYLFFDIFHS